MSDFHAIMKSWLVEQYPQYGLSQKGPAETIVVYLPTTPEEINSRVVDRQVTNHEDLIIGKWVASVQLYKRPSGGEVGIWDKDRRFNYYDLGDPGFFEKAKAFIDTARPSEWIDDGKD